MNIALIGSGGREHAICQKISQSKIVNKIICIPGNAGTAEIAENITVDVLDFKKILKTIKSYEIDMVVVGPEEPLVKGIVNFLNKNKIKVFGPNKFASKLEGSKAFMKKICKENNIPTANFKICKNIRDINNFLKKNTFPMVVKADGLAAGKGVTICKDKRQLLSISDQIFKGKFKSSNKIVMEEYLEGEEASYFIIVDKNSFKFFGSAQDHKRVGEKDKGPNTGGMGAYSPAPIVTKELEKKIINKIIKPTLNALKQNGNAYKGFLYIGLMIKRNEPFLIEFNVRMGDPECQVIIPRLKTDLVKIFQNSIQDRLYRTKIKWKNEKCMTIALCSKGYPGSYKKNILIPNFDDLRLKKNQIIFHAGTKRNNNNLYSTGGRVLNFTFLGKNFFNIRKEIIKVINKLNWTKGFYRRDIGWRIKR